MLVHVGQAHVTYGYFFNINNTEYYKYDYYDVITDITVNIALVETNSFYYTDITQKNTNTLHNNTYILQGIYGKIVSSNMTMIEAEWFYDFLDIISHVAIFANTSRSYFEFI